MRTEAPLTSRTEASKLLQICLGPCRGERLDYSLDVLRDVVHAICIEFWVSGGTTTCTYGHKGDVGT